MLSSLTLRVPVRLMAFQLMKKKMRSFWTVKSIVYPGKRILLHMHRSTCRKPLKKCTSEDVCVTCCYSNLMKGQTIFLGKYADL